MGLLTAKKILPTATDLARYDGSAQTTSGDPEKGSSEEHDVAGAGTPHHRVDPAIEKRVIRKLDMTVTPLVAGLCEKKHTTPTAR